MGKGTVKQGLGKGRTTDTGSSEIATGPANARQKADCLVVATYRKASGAEDIVDLQRLVDLAEPLGAVGRAAASALVER